MITRHTTPDLSRSSAQTSPLARFNQQVIQCQDDAYTLALYLIGCEARADAATQAAVMAAYNHLSDRFKECRLLLLRQVVQRCQGLLPDTDGLEQNAPVPGFERLPEKERLALVLIDVLGLSYHDAALVACRPQREISRSLSQARKMLAER